MSQLEGVVDPTGGLNVKDCEDPQFVDWLQKNKLIKFYIPLTEYLGIDSIESCLDLDAGDIPRICQNIPNDVKQQYNIMFKDEVLLKKQLKLLIRNQNQAKQRQPFVATKESVQQGPHVHVQQQNEKAQRFVRNATKQETMYLSKLQNTRTGLRLLLDEKIKNEEKENEQRYNQALGELKAVFDELHSKLRQVYENNKEMVGNEYKLTCLSKQQIFERKLKEILVEMDSIEKEWTKSIQFDSIHDYMKVTQNQSVNEIGQANALKMKNVIDKYDQLVVSHNNHTNSGNEKEKKFWNRVDAFCQQAASNVNILDVFMMNSIDNNNNGISKAVDKALVNPNNAINNVRAIDKSNDVHQLHLTINQQSIEIEKMKKEIKQLKKENLRLKTQNENRDESSENVIRGDIQKNWNQFDQNNWTSWNKNQNKSGNIEQRNNNDLTKMMNGMNQMVGMFGVLNSGRKQFEKELGFDD